VAALAVLVAASAAVSASVAAVGALASSAAAVAAAAAAASVAAPAFARSWRLRPQAAAVRLSAKDATVSRILRFTVNSELLDEELQATMTALTALQ